MHIDWQQLLNTVFSGAMILAVVSYLLKTVLNHGLNRDMESFKARLQASADVEIEKLKSNLQMVGVEHQVRFSNLHLKRAEMIAEIYGQMVDAEQIGKQFVYQDSYIESKRQEAYFETGKKLIDFYFFVEKRRIYLPDHICALLTTFLDTVRRSVIRMNIYVPVDQPYNPQLLEEKVKTIKAAYEAFDESIPAARKALETEFRAMLGVE